MKNRIKQIALTISAGIIFLTCTNPFFPGPVDNTPKDRSTGPKNYIVTFIPGEGAELVNKTTDAADELTLAFAPLHLTAGAKIPKLPALKRTGYAFGGWYREDTFNTLWNFDTPVTGDMSLYAKWVQEPPPGIKVHFEANSGTPKPNDQNLDNGTLVVEPPPMVKTGYAFDGWYKEAIFTNRWNFSADTVTTPGSIITLYAKWHQIVYTVNFVANGGSPAPADQNIASGGKVFMPPAVDKFPDGFVDWYKDAAYTNVWNFASDTVTGNITLYAKWDNPNFSVTFNIFDENGDPEEFFVTVPSNAKLIYQKENITLINPGKIFAGWYKESTFDTLWDFANDTVTGVTSLWSKWVDSPPCTVSFNSNEGDPAPNQQKIAPGSKAEAPPPMTRTGYGFGGWYKEAAYNNEWNFASDTVSEDITLYAKWVQNRPMYTVTFKTNSSIDPPPPQTIIESGKITEPLGSTMRQDGYSFRGWYTEDGALWNFATGTVSGNMTLHAEWSIIYYTVIFNTEIIDSYTNNQNIIYGGGDQKPENQSIAYGGKINEPLDMTRDSMAIVDGYGFDGWWLWADSGAPAEWIFENYTVGPDYVTTGTTNINLYPRWIKDQKYLDYPTNTSDSSYPINNGNLVWVRKGSFTMGKQPVSGSKPEHQVTLTNGFFMGMYLVTRDQYRKVMDDDPSSNKIDLTLPTSNVTWLDAIMFCNELTRMENEAKGANLTPVYTIDQNTLVFADGSKWPPVSNKTIISGTVTINWNANGYRLPTEAEWEYAARNGKSSTGNFDWAGSNTASEVAWFSGTGGNSSGKTHPVGLLKPNILRTFDMSGNVCEWCWDEFASGYYTTSSPSITDPKGPDVSDTVIINNPGKDTARVRRGGSWNHGINNTRTFIRDSFQPTDINMQNYWTIGFRVVRGPLQ